MKSRIAVMTAIMVVMYSSAFAQYSVNGTHGAMLTEGRPFFTDGSLYSGYYTGGSPLGLFDIGSASRVEIELGLRNYSLAGESGTYLSGQKLRTGDPGRAIFELHYGPDFLSSGDADMTLHRFGFAMAAQLADGIFRTALSADGYIGTQKWENAVPDSSRVYRGISKFRLDMGSRPTPLLSAGAYASFIIHSDTLHVPGADPAFRREFATMATFPAPEIGVNVDFGGEDMPVHSSLALSYTSSAFTYGARGVGGSTPNVNNNGNANAIVNDSFQLFWLAGARLPLVEEQYVVKPGLLIGFTTNSGKMRLPDDKDNLPFKIGDDIPNATYDLGGFYFGMGAGAEILKYADVHIEYLMASMSLECGSAFLSPVVKDRVLHHTTLGVSAPLNNFIEMPVVFTPRLAYFVSGAAGIVPSRHSTLDPLNNVPQKSRRELYEPHLFLSGFERTSGFTIGADGSALANNMLSFSAWMTFLNKKIRDNSESGTELGLSAGLSF